MNIALRISLPTFFIVSTLSAQTQLYWGGGSVDIADDTTIPTPWASLSGTWDTTTQNWATAPASPNSYQAWTSGAIFNGTFAFTAAASNETPTITLANDFNAGGLNINLTGTTSRTHTGKWVTLAAGSARTLTLADNAVINVTSSSPGGTGIGLDINSASGVSLVGNGFTKTGNSILRLGGSHNAVTGTVNITHDATLSSGNSPGIVYLNGGATLAGVTRFNVSASGAGDSERASLTAIAAASPGTNQLDDGAVINLSGLATFEYRGRSGVSETTGSLRLNSAGVLNVSALATGTTGTGALTFASGIDRANDRAQLLVVTNSSGVMTSTVNLGSSHGLGTGVLPWAADNRGRLMRVDGSNNLVAATTTDVTNAASVTNGSVDYRIVGDSTQLAGATFASGAQANTLGFYRGTNANPVTVTVTDTLTISSGGLAIGNDANQGSLTITGGTSLTTSDGNPLYIHTGNSGTGSVIINTPITGNIDVAKNGVPSLSFSGSSSNTYTGTTYVNGGQLILGKTGSAVSIAGNAVIRSGGTLSLGNGSGDNQIATTSTITIEKGGYFLTSNRNPTIKALVGGGMLQANLNNSTFTVTDSVTIGDGGIGTFTNDRSAASTGATFAMATGAVFNIELAGDGSSADQMAFYNFTAGELVLNNNALNLSLVGPQEAGEHTVSLFTFFSDSGLTAVNSSIVGGLVLGTLGAGISDAELVYNGSSIDLIYTVSAVPEPSTFAVIAGLIVAGGAVCRRRR